MADGVPSGSDIRRKTMKNIIITAVMTFLSIVSCNNNTDIKKIIPTTIAECKDKFECLKKGIELLPIETCYTSYGENNEEECKTTGNEKTQACPFFKKACELESSDACFYVAEYCTDHQKSHIYSEKACDLENALACFDIGLYYHNMEDSAKTSKEKAVKYFQKACDNGYKAACLLMDSPSFNCDKAYSYTEKTICSNVILSELDKKMKDEYNKLISDKNIKSKAIAAQREWIKYTRNTCNTATCLKNEYIKRIKDLQERPAGVSTISFTGSYKYNSYDNQDNLYNLRIRQNGDIFVFHLTANDLTVGETGNIYGESRDTISGVAKVNGNIAVFKKDKCTLNFKLNKNKIEVTDNNCEDIGSFSAKYEKIR